ncbi:MAG: hypothetical protein J0I41_22305 [Filimonas sp.]|nr:hypothetical protein [Filimonas sp.]
MKRLLIVLLSVLLCLTLWQLAEHNAAMPAVTSQEGGEFFYYHYGIGQPNCVVPLLRHP